MKTAEAFGIHKFFTVSERIFMVCPYHLFMLKTAASHMKKVVLLFCLILPALAQPNLPPAEMDVRMGAQEEREILLDPYQYPILDRNTHAVIYSYLEQIKTNLLKSGQVRHAELFPWKIYVIDDPSTVNAFATPGGYLYIYTGLLLYADNEAELAGVMAHEVAHADLRHAAQTMQPTGRFGFGRRRRGGQQLLGRLRSLRFSRGQELEADEQSAVYMCATDYHAESMLGFLERMAEEEGSNQLPRFLDSHPSDSQRLQLLSKTIAELKPEGQSKGEIRHDGICRSLETYYRSF